MKLFLKRIAKRKNYTIGKLYLRTEEVEDFRTYTSEKYLCDTLEPPCIEMKVDRIVEEVLNDKSLLKSIKPCAIPEGRYSVVITWSPKFKEWLPLLLGGPLFNSLWQGIRIHAGNKPKDTQGCILVGRNQIVGQVLESRKWLYELKEKIVAAKEKGEAVWLTIKSNG